MTLKVIHRLQAFSNAVRQTFVQHSTWFQLTVCSHGSSAWAELVVPYDRHTHGTQITIFRLFSQLSLFYSFGERVPLRLIKNRRFICEYVVYRSGDSWITATHVVGYDQLTLQRHTRHARLQQGAYECVSMTHVCMKMTTWQCGKEEGRRASRVHCANQSVPSALRYVVARRLWFSSSQL